MDLKKHNNGDGGNNLVWQGPKNADDGEELKNIGVLHVRRHVGEHLNMFSLSQYHDYEVLCAHQ